jgi:hypothetical protein
LPSRHALVVLILASASPGMTACATIFHGINQGVHVDSRPAGAVASSGNQRTETPGVLEIHRKADSTSIRIEKPGYHPAAVTLQRRTSGLVWANAGFILGGVLLGGAAALGESLGETGSSSTDTILLGSGILVGLAGFAVDLASGGAHRQDPATIETELQPVE